ncbi:hypothetical protein KQ945_11690 [Bacillus subtilis subsp. subtilis]|nr:hypothetical protein [Bacillus subtilis subsp. subtilis]
MGSFSGWLVSPYKLARELSPEECKADLRAAGIPRLDPLNKGAIHLDATCLEYLDRFFLLRGWALMGGGFLALFCVTLGTLGIYGFLQSSHGEVEPVFWGIVIMALMCGLPALVALKLFVLKDVFRYTHYPVRFNRANRTVYVFTGGPKGYVDVPFDEAFFFIHQDGGTAANTARTYDLRMHILRDGKIIHTVAIGSDGGGSPGIVLAHWEMIRRFMEEGITALPFPPLGIFASSRVSLKNALIIPFAILPGVLSWILSPFLIVIGACRYIALATSRRPVWPSSVIAACAAPASSPVFREPVVYGDLPGGDKGEAAFTAYWKGAEAKARQQDESLSRLFR